MNRKITLIESPSQLHTLFKLRIFGGRPLGEIRLDPSFQHVRRNTLEKSINRLYKGPGYRSCLLYFVIGATAGTLITLFEFLIFNHYLVHPAITVLSLAVVAGLTGKCVGIINTRSQLKQTVSTIQKYWQPRKSSD